MGMKTHTQRRCGMLRTLRCLSLLRALALMRLTPRGGITANTAGAAARA